MGTAFATPPPLGPQNRPRRILVVDDEETVRTLLQRYLQRQGFEVLAAQDGLQALELFRDNPCDLILSDVRMPGLDGISLLKAVKEINRRVPVVLISGFGEVETVVAALKAGAENFLSKPLKMETLGRVVEHSLAVACMAPSSITSFPQVRQITYLQSPSVPELVCELVQVIALSAVNMGFAEHDLDNNLKLALVEAITNGMEHGNLWDAGKSVFVECEISPSTLRVKVEDQGPGFAVRSLPDPTTEEYLLAERGRGVFLMQAIMDEVVYNQAGNQVTLVKRKAPPEDKAA